MSLQNLSVMKNATSGTTVGGTAMSMTTDGVEVKNGLHVADMSEANFIIRTNATFKTRNPQRLPDGTYSKAKRDETFVVPKILADGSVVFNVVRNSIEAHPETTDAELTNLMMLGAQGYTDSDFTSFLKYGSLA